MSEVNYTFLQLTIKVRAQVYYSTLKGWTQRQRFLEFTVTTL